MAFDILITGGRVFDPEKRAFSRADIAVADGRVARIAPDLADGKAARVIDAKGLMVTPGLIDFHVHTFRLVHRIGIDADIVAARAGTTTMVDGGSAGALNFDAFREFILERSRLNLFAFLNISILGQCFEAQIPGVPVVHEYDDMRLVHVAQTIKCIEENRDYLVGVKVRAYHGLTNLTPIYAALEAAAAADVPVMIHTSPPPPSVAQYMHLLRPGDIVTHLYHPDPGSLVRRDGKIRPEYLAARERGVIFETGFARVHTDFEIMKRAVDEGFWPDIISTDLNTNIIEEMVFDVLFTASKLIALGMSLEGALCAMTIAPARAMNRPDLAELKEGGKADISVLEWKEEDITFNDYYGHTMPGKGRLICRTLVNKGEVFAGA